MEIRDILRRIKQILKIRTDKELCEILDIKYNTLDVWKNRKSIPVIRLEQIAKQLNVDTRVLLSDDTFSDNTSHQILISNEFMEVVELFKKYGNSSLLTRWKDDLLKIKQATDG